MSTAKPPYPLLVAQNGQVPEIVPDIPILALYLVLYGIAALLYLGLVWRQVQRKRIWTISGLMFLFAGERVVALVMRMVWAFRLTDINIALSSQIFIQVGVVLLYLTNMTLAGAIIRLTNGHDAWVKALLAVVSILTLISFISFIVAIIISVFTLHQATITACLNVERAAATYFTALAVAPQFLLIVAYVSHRDRLFQMMRSTWIDVAITSTSSILCTLMAGFKAGVIWTEPRPIWNPAWFHRKPAFYVLELGPELLVLALFLMTRMDARYHVLLTGKDDSSVPVLLISNGHATAPDHQDMRANDEGAAKAAIGPEGTADSEQRGDVEQQGSEKSVSQVRHATL